MRVIVAVARQAGAGVTGGTQMGHTAMAMVDERRDLLEVSQRLVQEFRDRCSAGTVLAEVTICRTVLVRTGVRAGLAAATEAMARCRLLRKEDADAAQELARRRAQQTR